MSAVPLTDRGRRTREALVVAARRVFEERGYDGTRMGDIAEAAGVSHGTVYTWFATKDAVLMAVVESLVDDLYASLSTPEAADPLAQRKAHEKAVAAMLRAGHQYEHARFILAARSLEDVEEWLGEAADEEGMDDQW